MVAIRRDRLSRSIQTVRHGNLAMLRSKTQFHFHLLNKSLAADRERLRPAIVSSRYVSAQSCFDPFTMGLLKFSNIIETAKLTQRQKINDAIASSDCCIARYPLCCHSAGCFTTPARTMLKSMHTTQRCKCAPDSMAVA
jgi:hypothetical protein